MSSPSVPAERIVAERLFVVEVRQAVGGLSLSGRVESVASGEHIRFESLDELDGFIRRSCAPLASADVDAGSVHSA